LIALIIVRWRRYLKKLWIWRTANFYLINFRQAHLCSSRANILGVNIWRGLWSLRSYKEEVLLMWPFCGEVCLLLLLASLGFFGVILVELFHWDSCLFSLVLELSLDLGLS
jgi:hypothetical protein